MENVAIRTTLPLFLLIGAGFIARKAGLLKAGDERVLSAYVYYFALPALFFVNMAEMNFTYQTLTFIVSGMIPVVFSVGIYVILRLIFRFSRDTLYLLIVTTVFGSHAFFGIPFIMFAFPTSKGEQLATLGASAISIVSVVISLVVLELHKMGAMTLRKGSKKILSRFSKNPLIISILSGFLISVIRLEVPSALAAFFHMLGKTTATIALFMLGMFLYGRSYGKLGKAMKLALLRMVLLPIIGVVTVNVLGLSGMEKSVIVLMLSMPLAISMIVLSERYDFHQDTIASLILVSSLSAGVYLNLWLMILQ